MKAVKWLVIIGGSLVVLVIAALLIIPAFVDINKYKPEIENQVAKATGRAFSIGSDLDLTLNSLYFKTDAVDSIPYSEVTRIRESNLAQAIPIHAMSSQILRRIEAEFSPTPPVKMTAPGSSEAS